jgi:hypothetical protein
MPVNFTGLTFHFLYDARARAKTDTQRGRPKKCGADGAAFATW